MLMVARPCSYQAQTRNRIWLGQIFIFERLISQFVLKLNFQGQIIYFLNFRLCSENGNYVM